MSIIIYSSVVFLDAVWRLHVKVPITGKIKEGRCVMDNLLSMSCIVHCLDSLTHGMRSGLKWCMMARNPRPLLQEVVMLVILIPGRSLVISWAHSN